MVRLLGEGAAKIGNKKTGVSSFQAFCISTASRVGTGNLAGVAIAITLGGPGAVLKKLKSGYELIYLFLASYFFDKASCEAFRLANFHFQLMAF